MVDLAGLDVSDTRSGRWTEHELVNRDYVIEEQLASFSFLAIEKGVSLSRLVQRVANPGGTD